MECLADNVSALLSKIKKKYKEYGMKDQKPFVIVKPDAGTYGMGIMTVKDASEVKDLNRKQRNKMSVIKDGVTVTDVMIQEGVPTFESINDAVAEPVVYMIDRYVVGGFYRIHAERGIDQNLNAPGSQYVPLAFAQQHAVPDLQGQAGHGGAEPLLRVRRGGAPGVAGGVAGAGAHRSGSGDLLIRFRTPGSFCAM